MAILGIGRSTNLCKWDYSDLYSCNLVRFVQRGERRNLNHFLNINYPYNLMPSLLSFFCKTPFPKLLRSAYFCFLLRAGNNFLSELAGFLQTLYSLNSSISRSFSFYNRLGILALIGLGKFIDFLCSFLISIKRILNSSEAVVFMT